MHGPVSKQIGLSREGSSLSLCRCTILSVISEGSSWANSPIQTQIIQLFFRVYPGFATKIRQKFISLLLWNRYLMPSSDARRSVGSRWASVCRGWTAVPLPYKGFPARCGCPCSVHTVAACGEVHGLSMRSPALTRHGLDHVDALVQKSPEFSTLTFGRAGTVTTAFRGRKHLVVCCESRI